MGTMTAGPVVVDDEYGWDTDGNYTYPWQPGDRLCIIRGGTVITGTVARVEGYLPGIVEVEGDVRVDTVGAVVQRLNAPEDRRTADPDAGMIRSNDRVRVTDPHLRLSGIAEWTGRVVNCAGVFTNDGDAPQWALVIRPDVPQPLSLDPHGQVRMLDDYHIAFEGPNPVTNGVTVTVTNAAATGATATRAGVDT